MLQPNTGLLHCRSDD